MFISPLTDDELKNLENFKYKSTDNSILYAKVLSPSCNVIVNFIPNYIAPNLITVFSVVCNFIAFIFSMADGGFSFKNELKPSTCLIIGITQLLYLYLDNLDGKQARKTGTSGPFGMLLDHGCDVFTNVFTAFNVSKMLIVGDASFYTLSCFIGLYLGFYIMTYEEYILGEIHFPAINGTDEGNFVVGLAGVILYFTGQSFFKKQLFSFMTFGQFIGIMIFFAGLSCVYNCFIHIYQKLGLKEALKMFLDNIFFYSLILVPIYFLYIEHFFFIYDGFLLIINTSLLFSRLTIDLQIIIVTGDKIKCSISNILLNILFYISIINISYTLQHYILVSYAIIQLVTLSTFVYIRWNEILNYLNLYFLKINV